MNEEKQYSYRKINHFTDIEAWKLARKLKLEIYAIIKELPPEERFDLGSQMRRAAVSCTANIAEGYGRFHSRPVKCLRISCFIPTFCRA